MGRGRPIGSVIRNNIAEILFVMGKGYGYDIYKAYRVVFPPCTLRSIYYHLNKGVQTGEFAVESVKKEEGEYSWGSVVEKTYYKLGSAARVQGDSKVREHFERKGEGRGVRSIMEPNNL
ncbi:TPA: hypothetical protein HA361_03505 [Candidatus Woesearchaeota archaeon]|nr:hypothetical protein [Candidatus Woesearchaeota archaeon]HII68490.1 hypothetical protein [Candidatus Woesearchaeota archaeon]